MKIPYSFNSDGGDNNSVKCTIKDLPLSYTDTDIMNMLRNLGAKVNSDIKFGMAKDKNNTYTKWKNGDRFVFIEKDQALSHPLPRFHMVGMFQCRIFHYGQSGSSNVCGNCLDDDRHNKPCTRPRACRVCQLPGHREGTPKCESFYKGNKSGKEHVEVFGGKEDELSNFYPCEFKHNNITVNSSEMAYQYEKAMRNGLPELAQKILECRNAVQAKNLGLYVNCDESWERENMKVMEDIAKEKVSQVQEVRDKLLSTEDKIIAEAVPSFRDHLWGTGLSKEATTHTKIAKWPGKNNMGKIWMNVRKEIRKDKTPNKNDKDSKKRNLSSESKTTPYPRRQKKDQTNNAKHHQAKMDQFTVKNKEDDLSSDSDDEYAEYLSGR